MAKVHDCGNDTRTVTEIVGNNAHVMEICNVCNSKVIEQVYPRSDV